MRMCYDMEDFGCKDKFLSSIHVKFFRRCLDILPQRFESLDSSSCCNTVLYEHSIVTVESSHQVHDWLTLQPVPKADPKLMGQRLRRRLVATFFAVSGLDVLNFLGVIENKQKYIDWIYFLQIVPDEKESNLEKCGFRGTTSCIFDDPENKVHNPCDVAHIAMTYTALATLIILGDDLSRVNRKGIISGLRSLQLPDGSFRPIHSESENDMRFVYCAACISYILQDWSGVDIDKAVSYIQSSMAYDGGIAQRSHLESHGGSTFCAVAALILMGKLYSAFTKCQIERLRRWCILRQVQQDGGFQGRPNKPTDTCYSFWVGATLKLLDGYHFVNKEALKKFIFSAQDSITGGIAKWESEFPDPLHSYFAISGLAVMEHENTTPVNAALNVSERASDFLISLHKKWKEKPL